MPFWLNNCTVTQPTGTVTTVPVWIDANCTAATMTPTTSLMLRHAQMLNHSFNQTATACANTTTWSSPTSAAANTQITTAAATAYYYWVEGDTYVDQQTYAMLAQGRLWLHQARTEEQRLEEARRQEEREAALRLRREQEEAFRAQSAADRLAALARSRELLLSHLSKEQRKTLEKKKFFVVIGGKTKKTYRINTGGYTRNIEELDGNRVVYRLCGHLRGDLPLHDHHVAQKISLEYDEEAFVRICNRSAA